MSGAQEYYDGLITQGHAPEAALGYTQQHFPDFQGAAAAPAPAPAPAAAAAPAPIEAAPMMAAAPIAAAPGAAVMEVTPTTATPMAAAPVGGAAPLMTGAPMASMPMGQVMAAQTGGKSKVTAGILGILLGGIGVHKFYMGKIGMGILYLVFSWTMIPALAGLIEGIMYLVQDETKFHSRYA